MKKHKIFTLLIAVALLLPAIFGVSQVFAANPSFTIGEVTTDVSVTILIKDAPKNREFIVRMGEYDTKAIDGIDAGRFNTGEGGALKATLEIPEALKGRAQISIRMDSVTGGWYYYHWFWNKKDGGTWPAPSTKPVTQPTQSPPATSKPAKIIPSITILSAVESTSVTISASNFPKNTEIKPFLGKMYSRGLKGIELELLTTDENGKLEATLAIPAELANEERVAIRLESQVGTWFAYNWFWNKQGGNVITPPGAIVTTPSPKPDKNAPIIYAINVEAGKEVTIKVENLKPNIDFTILLGKMGTKGEKGTAMGLFNSENYSSTELTVDIPADLANESLIAIRIESPNGYYAYNWFLNK